MKFVAGMTNNTETVNIVFMSKVMTMPVNSRSVIGIVCVSVVSQKRDPHVFVRPDLKMSFCLTYVGTVACTARELI